MSTPAPDVFISYCSEDRPLAENLARALVAAGRSVWWDRDIVPGTHFDQAIEHALISARCVVVLWTSNSVKSHWVKEEAGVAAERGVLFPLLVGGAVIPLGFRRLQTIQVNEAALSLSSEIGKRLATAISVRLSPASADADSSAATLQQTQQHAVKDVSPNRVRLKAAAWPFPHIPAAAAVAPGRPPKPKLREIYKLLKNKFIAARCKETGRLLRLEVAPNLIKVWLYSPGEEENCLSTEPNLTAEPYFLSINCSPSFSGRRLRSFVITSTYEEGWIFKKLRKERTEYFINAEKSTMEISIFLQLMMAKDPDGPWAPE